MLHALRGLLSAPACAAGCSPTLLLLLLLTSHLIDNATSTVIRTGIKYGLNAQLPKLPLMHVGNVEMTKSQGRGKEGAHNTNYCLCPTLNSRPIMLSTIILDKICGNLFRKFAVCLESLRESSLGVGDVRLISHGRPRNYL